MNLETSNFVHWLTIASPILPKKNLPWKGRGQGHVSNFYIVDLENFATASRRYTGDIHNSTVVGLFMTPATMVECTLFMTHCLRLNLQLHTISLVRACRISSFCTVAWQLARLLLTRRIPRSLGDSWASYPRDAMLARVLAMALCPCLSVTSRCSIKSDERINLLYGVVASLH